MWRMLPGRVYIARGYLPPGEHVVTVNGRALPDPVKIDVQYALVPCACAKHRADGRQWPATGQTRSCGLCL